MTTQFCTNCRAKVLYGQRFCDDCGHSLVEETTTSDGNTLPITASETTIPAVSPIPPIPAGQEKITNNDGSNWAKWLDVGSKTAGLGAPFAAAFDFLSPRIALLPIAASVAVAGLLATMALRKFVAPSLPLTSKFRAALAPEAGLHRSRLMIGTGVLSALMVTGAAWSNANSLEGGVIASKFDAARVAQMQLGILQAMQKEQRQQTAVLEDIREGRATDPRRELGNIGGGFSGGELDTALDRGDSRTVRLLLAGGLKWRVSNAYVAYESGDPKMPALLLENKAGFEMRSRDCENLITEKFGAAEPLLSSIKGASAQLQLESIGKPSKQLQTFQKSFMKAFCAMPDVQQFLKSKILVLREEQQKATRSRNLCIQNKTARRANDLESKNSGIKYKLQMCVSSDCSDSYDRLKLSAHDENQHTKVVQEVCTEEFPLGSNSEIGKSLDLSSTYQQLLDSIS